MGCLRGGGRPRGRQPKAQGLASKWKLEATSVTWIRAHRGARCQLDDSVRSRERQPADTAAVRQECSGDTFPSMTTVIEDGERCRRSGHRRDRSQCA
eukprot:7385464-Prymnesium_polylepis.1